MRIRVSMHSTERDFLIDLDKYDAEEINRLRNDSSVESILLGDHSLSRIDIKNIIREDEAE